MSKPHRLTGWIVLASAILLIPAHLEAQKKGGGGGGGGSTTTYVRDWSNFCVGTTFRTCGSVQLRVTGVNVELRAWNFSGGELGGNAGAVITNIALSNMGSIYTTSTATTAGTYYTAASGPLPFTITDTNSGAGGTVELSKSTLTGNGTASHGLASSCAVGAGIPSGISLWMTETAGCSASQIASMDGTNYVHFNFAVNQEFDPNAAGIQLGLTSVDVNSPLTQHYYEVYATPEPTSMLLLGSGLLGLGGMGLKRRRREEPQVEGTT